MWTPRVHVPLHLPLLTEFTDKAISQNMRLPRLTYLYISLFNIPRTPTQSRYTPPPCCQAFWYITSPTPHLVHTKHFALLAFFLMPSHLSSRLLNLKKLTRSPQKVWDIAPASESLTSLPGLFKLRNGLQSLRPAYSADMGNTQTQDENRQPKLLQRWVVLCTCDEHINFSMYSQVRL